MKTQSYRRFAFAALALVPGAVFAQDANWAKEPMEELTTVVVSVNAGSNEAALNSFVEDIRSDLNIDLQVIGLPFEEQYAVQLLDMQVAHQHNLYVFWPLYMAEYAPYLTPLAEVAPDGETQVETDMNFSDVDPSYRWVWKFNDQVYGVQIDGDVKILHYRADLTDDPGNKAAFEEKYGYAYDMQDLTWEQYLDVAKFFNEQGQGVFGTAEIADFLAGFYWKDRLVGMGGHLFSYDDMTPCYPSRDVCVNAFQNAIDTFTLGSPPEAQAYNFDDTRVQFQGEGRAVMHIMWPEGWRLANDADNASSTVQCKVDVALMPGFATDSGEVVHRPEMAGGRVIGMSAASDPEVKEAAYKVLAYISQQDKALSIIVNTDTLLDPWTTSQMMPENFTYAADGCEDKADQYVEVLKASTAAGYPALQIPGASRYFEAYERVAREAFSGQLGAEEATDKLIGEFDTITDDLGRDEQVAAYQSYVDNVLKPLNLWE